MKTKLAWAVGLAILSAGIVLAEGKPSQLDGTTWKVDVHPDGMAKDKGEKEFHETITFADGKLVTNEGRKLGFASAPYVLSRSGDNEWSFTADQESASQGLYVWTGTVHKDDIQGKLVWTKNDDTVFTYTFKGDKKK
jgi:hypothetical protein